MTKIFYNIITDKEQIVSVGLIAVTNICQWKIAAETEDKITYFQYPYNEKYCDKVVYNKNVQTKQEIHDTLYRKKNNEYVEGYREIKVFYFENQDYTGNKQTPLQNKQREDVILFSDTDRFRFHYNCSHSIKEYFFKIRDVSGKLKVYLNEWLKQFKEVQFYYTDDKDLLETLLDNQYDFYSLRQAFKNNGLDDNDLLRIAYNGEYGEEEIKHNDYKESFSFYNEYQNELGKGIWEYYRFRKENVLYNTLLNLKCYSTLFHNYTL